MAFYTTAIPALFLVSIVFLLFISLNNTIINHTIGVNFQFVLFLIGSVLSALLVWYEIDSNNPLLKKVCTGISKGNCNAILNSKQAKLFSWLGWSEIGFFYFSGGLLLLIFSGKYLNENIFIVSWFTILAAPYTIFSVYYQWQVLKQWCVLCLLVQFVLLSGLLNVLINNFEKTNYRFSVSLMSNAVLLYLLPVLFWFSVKPYILRLQEAKNTKRKYLQFKLNKEIFKTLLKKQNPIKASTDGLGIDFGNLEATNTLLKVCNPYCINKT